MKFLTKGKRSAKMKKRAVPFGMTLLFLNFISRTSQLVSPSGRDVAQRQRGQAPSLRELSCRLAARLREFCQIDKIRIRFTLRRTHSRAALSVICFANASSPKGRAKKPVRTVRLTNQSDSHTDFLAGCSFRHGLRRATFLREEGLSQLYSCSHCCIHRALTASDGILQSPRGDSVTVPTFGPSGRQERLNCWIKNRRTNVVSHFLMVSSS